MPVEKIYWDTACFLGWFQKEDGREEPCRSVLKAAQDGKVVIVTSNLTLAEVLMYRGKKPIPKKDRELITKFFRNDYIVSRNVTRRIAEASREIVWDLGIKPKDAIHVATALDEKLSKFHTFDDDLVKKTGKLGNPRLIIEYPSVDEPELPMIDPNDTKH